MKYEKHAVRITKDEGVIMIDLLSPDGKTTTSTAPLGAIVLNKNQWKELKAFIEVNPDFEKDPPGPDQLKSTFMKKGA